jgi:hypothetical protein
MVDSKVRSLQPFGAPRTSAALRGWLAKPMSQTLLMPSHHAEMRARQADIPALTTMSNSRGCGSLSSTIVHMQPFGTVIQPFSDQSQTLK